MDNLASTECRKGEITTEFVRLNEAKEQLHNRIGVLLDRLVVLLKKPVPQKEQDCPPKQELQSQLAMDLSSISATVETDLETVNDILDRLEL